MKNRTVSSDFDTTYSIDNARYQWIFTRTSQISVDSGSGIKVLSDLTHLSVAGLAESNASSGVYFAGDDARLHVVKGGHVKGDDVAAFFVGTGNKVVNDGFITAIKNHSDAVSSNGTMDLDNSGKISGLTGLVLHDFSVVHNLSHGVITGHDFAGISILAGAGTISYVVNDGEIGGALSSITSGAGDEHVINHGKLIGDVDLGAGNDVLVDRGGTISGSFNAGLGDDTLVTDNAKDKFVEHPDEGTDEVQTYVSYKLGANIENLMLLGKHDIHAIGNKLANEIIGNAGDNRLMGGGGVTTDTLTGGKGNDDFVFTFNDGHYVITDFQPGHDRIGIEGYADIKGFSDLKGHISQQGDDVQIVVSSLAGRSIIVEHMQVSDIDKHDFFFG